MESDHERPGGSPRWGRDGDVYPTENERQKEVKDNVLYYN